MIISDTAVTNRISVLVLAAMILVFGMYCYSILPRESSPDITIPYVFVSTYYKGVASSDIESSITTQIEKKLKGLDLVKKIQSVSSEGLSQINIEFLPGTNIDDVLQKVKDKVDEAKGDLPSDLENDPLIFEVNFSEMPIVVYLLNGTCGIPCLKDIADDLEDDIEGIPGILEVDVTGGMEREIKIEVDPDKLSYYRIPITIFEQVLSAENQNTSGGVITLGDGRYQLRIPGEFKSPEEIYDLVISSDQGYPVYLKDVARVVDGFKDETSRSRLNGRDAVSISVKKRIGENIIAISEKIDALIETAQKRWPQGTQITKVMDRAKEIHLMVADLENNIISGLLLVIVILLFALGLRNAILVSMAIPFSMFLSFIMLQAAGITLNMVVLFSLTLALGMLVDNAIVIVENIYRYMEQGVPRIQAAMKGTSEVAYPVIGSTLTTLAAFFPMIFWPGIMGEFMKFLPITLVITLFSSLLVALVINPALCAFFIKVSGNGHFQAMDADQISQAGEKPIEIKGVLLTLYDRVLRGALKNRLTVIGISFAALILLVQIWMYQVGLEKAVEFFPPIDPKDAYVNVEMPEGADLEYIDRIMKKIEIAITGYAGDTNDPEKFKIDDYSKAYSARSHKKARGDTFDSPSDLPNVEYIYTKAVETSGSSVFENNSPNHIGIQFLDFEDRITPSVADLEKVRNRVKYIPGAEITVSEAQEGPPTGAAINIEISGDNFQTLGQLARHVRDILQNIPHVTDIQDDYTEGIPSIQISIDRQKAALFGLTTHWIGQTLKTAYNGLDVSTYRENDEDYDITVTFGERDRQKADVLNKLMISSSTGYLVPLTTIANIDYSGSIGDIVRINHERVVTVKANVDETKIPGPVARQHAEDRLKDFPMPSGYRIKFTGEFEDQQESEAFLTRAFGIALFLIFLILVTLFNSVTQPLIIMTSVILSLGGAFLGLTVIQSPFGVIMSGVGVISLAGVVVNNAIVLIDYTNKLMERGLSITEAVVAAGATRLRPVLLTAVTTVLGLLPMVTGISYDFHRMAMSYASDSTQWWQSMSIVVIFGLIVATFLTLVVVPVLYSLFFSMNRRFYTMMDHIKRWYWFPMRGYIGMLEK
ncbi:MAG: efflux RND transporter permease subunit [Candidatus Magnetomorum sp.]|nr:efflux RND transporter permease subunit [Candidatus Magnetomorum sp.]